MLRLVVVSNSTQEYDYVGAPFKDNVWSQLRARLVQQRTSADSHEGK